jgi:hypothetical protein
VFTTHRQLLRNIGVVDTPAYARTKFIERVLDLADG